MKRKQRTMALLIAVITVPVFLGWREYRQQRLNDELFAAIEWEDTPAALRILASGADANAEKDYDSLSLWQRILDLLGGRRKAHSLHIHYTPLLDSLIYHSESHDRKDSPELVAALLARGARVDVADQEGFGPIYHVLQDPRRLSARTLRQHGTNAATGTENSGMPTLEQRDVAIVEMLLKHGADPNRSGTPGTWETPLVTAIYRGDPAIVRCLLRHRADPNTAMVAHEGSVTSPLKYAEKHHLIEIARALRDAGGRK